MYSSFIIVIFNKTADLNTKYYLYFLSFNKNNKKKKFHEVNIVLNTFKFTRHKIQVAS